VPFRRDRRQDRHRRGIVGIVGEVVFSEPDVVEAERVGEDKTLDLFAVDIDQRLRSARELANRCGNSGFHESPSS